LCPCFNEKQALSASIDLRGYSDGTPTDIVKGAYLRSLSESLSIPFGTVARVETVGKTWQGEFVFTVCWQNIKEERRRDPFLNGASTSGTRPVHIDAVSKEEAAAASLLLFRSLDQSSRCLASVIKSKTANIGQLSVFTSNRRISSWTIKL
jgi:hypothetical protein